MLTINKVTYLKTNKRNINSKYLATVFVATYYKHSLVTWVSIGLITLQSYFMIRNKQIEINEILNLQTLSASLINDLNSYIDNLNSIFTECRYIQSASYDRL